MDAKQIGTVHFVQQSDLRAGPQTIIVMHEVAGAGPLVAFGEAIAMVARAQMIARVGCGRTLSVEIDDRRFELWQHFDALIVSEFSPRASRRLRSIAGRPEDVAAEAVAAFIEECDR
jgi:hypothetical protein